MSTFLTNYLQKNMGRYVEKKVFKVEKFVIKLFILALDFPQANSLPTSEMFPI